MEAKRCNSVLTSVRKAKVSAAATLSRGGWSRWQSRTKQGKARYIILGSFYNKTPVLCIYVTHLAASSWINELFSRPINCPNATGTSLPWGVLLVVADATITQTL